MRLIDADALEESLENSCKDTYETKMFVDFMSYVDGALTVEVTEDCINRNTLERAISELTYWRPTTDGRLEVGGAYDNTVYKVEDVWRLPRVLPSVTPQLKSEDMGEVSDGYHTFNQLYHQRAILFATIVNQNKERAWKSYKHEDGKYCFDKDGEWFIVGIDTPLGSYTYHYSKEYWDYFDCEELECGKPWDGHTEEDVTRLLSLPPVTPQPKKGEWIPTNDYVTTAYGSLDYYRCSCCGEDSLEECDYCPNCGADMREVRKNE